jgi:hypothetical protein
MQYAEELDAVLVETRRDIRTAAPRWQTEVPAKLHAAREHLTERLREEDALLDHLRSVIDTPPGQAPRLDPGGLLDQAGLDRPAVLAAAGRAGRLLEKCRERHHDLMTRVLAAIGVFLEAQQAQAFRPLGSLRIPDMGEEVLKPLLGLPVSPAEAVGAAFLTALSVSPRPMVRLSDLVEAMLAPARSDVIERPDPDPDGPGEEAPGAVPPELVTAAGDTVATVAMPVRLSTLLRTAARLHPASMPTGDGTRPAAQDAAMPVTAGQVASLIASAALWLFAPDDAEDDSVAMAHELFGAAAMAATDGTQLPADLVDGPWYGDDLLVAATEDQLLDAPPRPSAPWPAF